MHSIKLTTPVIAVATLLLFISSCKHRANEYQQNQGEIFATLYHVTYQHSSDLGDSIHNSLLAIDASLSVFNDTSIISKINDNRSHQTDPLFNQVFNKSCGINRVTNGAFDPTISPLINAWGFGFKNIDSVTPTLIDSLLRNVGMAQITLEGNRITKANPNITLNFSAIAKGYACDIIADLLRSHGICNYLVEIGGEVVAHGTNPAGEPWRIGINTPESGSREIEETILHLSSGAVATSGNYRNYHEHDGKRISHTINPLTGYPTESNLLSATVIAEDCITADAYATAFMVLGVERSLELADSLPNLETLLIYSTPNTTHAQASSANLHHYIK